MFLSPTSKWSPRIHHKHGSSSIKKIVKSSQKSSKVFVLFSIGLFTVALLLTRPSGRKMTLVSREAQVEATPRAQNLTPIRIPRLLPSSVMGNIWQWYCNLTNHVAKKFLRWRLQEGGCKPPLSTIRRWKTVIVNEPVAYWQIASINTACVALKVSPAPCRTALFFATHFQNKQITADVLRSPVKIFKSRVAKCSSLFKSLWLNGNYDKRAEAANTYRISK